MIVSFLAEIGVLLGLVALANSLIKKNKNWWKRRKELSHLGNPFVENPQISHSDVRTGIYSPVPPLPVRPVQQTLSHHLRQSTGGHISPPSIPISRTRVEDNLENYPKCPIHKCCNRKGQEQKIFWDSYREMWLCYRGHTFFS